MAVLFTIITGVGLTNVMSTITHSLSITPANLMADLQIHQVAVTATAPLILGTLGTNVLTAACGVGTLVTVDCRVWQQHSFVS